MINLHLIFNALAITCLTVHSLGNITRLEEERRPRYLEYLGDDGLVHIMDTKPQQKPILQHYSAYKDKVLFFLYTRHNREPQLLSTDNSSSLRNSNFNPNVSTIFIVHGWWGSAQSGPNPVIIQAYLEIMDINAIAIDWSDGAQDINYIVSVFKVPGVGKLLAKFIKFLNQAAGASFNNMHLIGHSLGSHIVGVAGREVQKITGAKVARITGLDPAGPLWSDNPNKLTKTDAVYVEAIHTNGGPFGFGTLKEWGAANFYPNGGICQPGCAFLACSHLRSYKIFASTVRHNNFIARKCSDIEAMLLNSCDGERCPMGNSDLRKTGYGVYRVDTGSEEPYNI